MIDRLEVLVPEDVPKRTEEWRKHRVLPANRSSAYAHTLDADCQLALRVHYNFRIPKARASRHFKIDFTDTRLLSAEDLLWRLARLFQIRPLPHLRLRRKSPKAESTQIACFTSSP